MRVFKLKRRYPSLPKTIKEGDTVEFNPQMGLYSKDDTLDTFKREEIEGHPDFWSQETTSSLVLDTYSNQYYRRIGKDSSVWKCLGRVIQDKAIDTIAYTIYVENITYGKRYKEIDPVLVTEDGEDIFAGEKFWWVNLNSTHPIWEHTCRERTEVNKKYKAFSTKILAQNYYIRNKPLLTLDDVYEVCNKAWTRGDGNPTSAFDSDLINLINSKFTPNERKFLF